jgi:ribonuclease Z
MLECGGKNYIIDMGCDITPELVTRGLTPNDISAVFITHKHGDHVDGLLPFVDLCSWYYTKADPYIMIPDMDILEALKSWFSLVEHLRDNIRFALIEEGLIYDDGNIRVHAMHTGHLKDSKSYAFMVEGEGKKAIFTGDIEHRVGAATDYARYVTEDGTDLVVAEGAHIDPLTYIEPLKRHLPKRFILNHYNGEWEEKAQRLINEMKNELKIVLATDGLEVRF